MGIGMTKSNVINKRPVIFIRDCPLDVIFKPVELNDQKRKIMDTKPK